MGVTTLKTLPNRGPWPTHAELKPLLQRSRRQRQAVMAGLAALLITASAGTFAGILSNTQTACGSALRSVGGAHGPHSQSTAPNGACLCGTQVQAPPPLSNSCRE
jgi:hypothetical protein